MSDVAHFQEEAEATRERIAATVGDLQAKLSPRALLHNAMAEVSDQGAQTVASLKRVAGANPAGIAGVGLAIGALLLGRAYVGRAKIDYGDKFAAYSDFDDGYGANSVDDRWHEDHPSLPAERGSLTTVARHSPLATLLVAGAAGAVLAALFPVSGPERDLFGELDKARR